MAKIIQWIMQNNNTTFIFTYIHRCPLPPLFLPIYPHPPLLLFFLISFPPFSPFTFSLLFTPFLFFFRLLLSLLSIILFSHLSTPLLIPYIRSFSMPSLSLLVFSLYLPSLACYSIHYSLSSPTNVSFPLLSH